LSQWIERLVERALEVELTDHVGYEPSPGAAGRCWQHAQWEHPEDVDH
jgi:hypothetical protein